MKRNVPLKTMMFWTVRASLYLFLVCVEGTTHDAVIFAALVHALNAIAGACESSWKRRTRRRRTIVSPSRLSLSILYRGRACLQPPQRLTPKTERCSWTYPWAASWYKLIHTCPLFVKGLLSNHHPLRRLCCVLNLFHTWAINIHQ